MQKKKRGEESPGKKEEGQGQEESSEGKGKPPAEETEGENQSWKASEAGFFRGVGGEETAAGSETGGSPSVAPCSPKENFSKAFSHLFFNLGIY